MKLLEILKVIPVTMAKYSRPLCFACGLAGIISTAILSVRASKKHDKVVASMPKDSTVIDKVKKTWTIWAVPVLSGAVTICCFGKLYFDDTKQINKLTLMATTAQAALNDSRNHISYEKNNVPPCENVQDNAADSDQMTWFYESAYGTWFQSRQSIVTDGIMMGEKHYQQTGQLTAAYLYDSWGIGWKRDERMDKEGWDWAFDDKEVKWVDIHTKRFPDAEHGWYTKIWYETEPKPFPWTHGLAGRE